MGKLHCRIGDEVHFVQIGDVDMNLKEFYDKIGGDYEGTIGRLYKEDLVKKFVKKFLNDKSYDDLLEYMKNAELEDAFRAVHTLKGVAINLGFTKLYNVSSTLTEALRHKEYDGTDMMLNEVKKEYKLTIDAINELDD